MVTAISAPLYALSIAVLTFPIRLVVLSIYAVVHRACFGKVEKSKIVNISVSTWHQQKLHTSMKRAHKNSQIILLQLPYPTDIHGVIAVIEILHWDADSQYLR